MKKGVGYILVLFIIIIAVASINRYKQYVLDRNFVLEVATACGATEPGDCFIAICESEDPSDCDTTLYKKVNIIARDAPKCLEEHTCADFSCNGIASCNITYCNDDSIEDGEECALGIILY